MKKAQLSLRVGSMLKMMDPVNMTCNVCLSGCLVNNGLLFYYLFISRFESTCQWLFVLHIPSLPSSAKHSPTASLVPHVR